MDNEALDLLPQATRPRVSEVGPRGLVFVGIELRWERRVGDYSLMVTLAEEWEEALSHWSVTPDSIHVGHTAIGYCVDLKPGTARFEMRIPSLGLSIAQRHLEAMIQTLTDRKRRDLEIVATAQFLHIEEVRSFEQLTADLSAKLFNLSFLQRTGCEMLDMSYLMDVSVNGEWFQISAGVLRAEEVLSRVASDRFGALPDVSRYVQVTTLWDVTERESDLAGHLSRVYALAASLEKEFSE
ncbi:MAG TPA: hypothetical protein VF092_08900 [Longimicrobium sp.]